VNRLSLSPRLAMLSHTPGSKRSRPSFIGRDSLTLHHRQRDR
jgi:hypothetical protein